MAAVPLGTHDYLLKLTYTLADKLLHCRRTTWVPSWTSITNSCSTINQQRLLYNRWNFEGLQDARTPSCRVPLRGDDCTTPTLIMKIWQLSPYFTAQTMTKFCSAHEAAILKIYSRMLQNQWFRLLTGNRADTRTWPKLGGVNLTKYILREIMAFITTVSFHRWLLTATESYNLWFTYSKFRSHR